MLQVSHAHTHTDRSLNKVDAGLQVEPEVYEVPLDAFTLVLLLLQHKHGVVKKLLQLFISVVYAQLLKGVQLQENIRKRRKDEYTGAQLFPTFQMELEL